MKLNYLNHKTSYLNYINSYINYKTTLNVHPIHVIATISGPPNHVWHIWALKLFRPDHPWHHS